MYGETRSGSNNIQAGSTTARTANLVEPVRTSAVAREIAAGKNIGSALHDLIDQLANRVEPVRLPQPPTGSTEGAGQAVAPTDLSRELQSLNGTFAEAGRRLTILLESIDL